jgi:organic radical activating enzyme
MVKIEQISIDLTNYCSKGCPFCYNSSDRDGATSWQPAEVIGFARSCIEGGVKAVSLGGGEPLEYEGVFDIIEALSPLAYLTLTTNGLPLDSPSIIHSLKLHKPDKIHISIHNADNEKEVARVLKQISLLEDMGIKPGVNILVNADKVEHCKTTYGTLRKLLEKDQIILIPQRFSDTPSPQQLASVTSGEPFQSPSCLLRCERPKQFASISWDKKVNWCSYAGGKQPLKTLDYQGLIEALLKVTFTSCQG